jgi:HAD superfamily 5'-nucleotidase-like hydrolase
MLEFDEQRKAYSRIFVDLAEPRWVFMNTLFSLSEASLYLKAVDLLDAGKLQPGLAYRDLYGIIRASIDEAHMEGAVKAAIVQDLDRFVAKDPDLALALLDLKHAGKKLLLITNSGWAYTGALLAHALDPHLPPGWTWRRLFDLAFVSARKPAFFQERAPAFEVVDDSGLLRPKIGAVELGKAYEGGNAELVEWSLGLSGDQILYVGDHVFADVRVSKSVRRWRTALVLRALEDEIDALGAFAKKQHTLAEMMRDKEALEHAYSCARIDLQRLDASYGPQTGETPETLRKRMRALRDDLVALDERIAPLAAESATLTNDRWGPLMRAGNDKSHLARQIERSADAYTSRVSNLLPQTPFVYLRAPRGSLPHDDLETIGGPE